MKAATYSRYGSPDVLSVVEVSTPTPGPSELLIRVRASTVGASDSVARQGVPRWARVFFGIRRPKRPVLGSEFAGEVAEVGEGTTRFAVGDRVFGATGENSGCNAEFLVIHEDAAVVRTPPALTDVEAASIVDGLLTALPFLRDGANLTAGQAVLVNGASGTVGSAAVQLAAHFGATVTAVCSGANVDLVRSLGATRVIDYTATDFTAGDERYDIVFDTVGKSSVGRCRRILTPTGLYLSTVPALGVFFSRRAKILFTGLRKPADKARDLTVLLELVDVGAIVPVVDSTYSLDSIAVAHARVDTGHKRGAVVIES